MPIPGPLPDSAAVARQLAVAQATDQVKPGFEYAWQSTILAADVDWHTLAELYIATPGTRQSRPIDSVLLKPIGPIPAADDPDAYMIEVGGFFHAFAGAANYPWNGYPLVWNEAVAITFDNLEGISIRRHPTFANDVTVAIMFSSRQQ